MVEIHSIQEFKKVISEIHKNQNLFEQEAKDKINQSGTCSFDDLWNEALFIPEDEKGVVKYIESIGGKSWNTVLQDINKFKSNEKIRNRKS